VLGVDINPEAVARARETVAGAAFEVGDIASPAGLELGGRTFAVVVCQLVVSVVGGPESRRALTRNAFEVLAPGGDFFLSASGLSATINPGYARLYELDYPETGEFGTYLSRDGEGKVLYETHHFEVDELRELLESTGFAEVSVQRRRETSSRRPGEAAYFLYAHGRRPEAC
jgi:SAM-dependent methyltransferase